MDQSASNGGATPPKQKRQVSPAGAFVLSLFAGVGHMYLGLMEKGVLLLGLYAVSWVVADSMGGAPVPTIVIAYAAFDALRIAKAINAGEVVEDIDLRALLLGDLPVRKGRGGAFASVIWGVILILFGTVLLLRNFGVVLPDVSAYWPVLLIGAGVWLVVGYFKGISGGGDGDE